MVTDPSNVVRRGLLYADDGVENYTSMGMALALGYLAADHIGPTPAEGDRLRLGKALIAPLDDSRGPYVRLDSAGYQTLLDYHGGPHRFPFRSIGEVMRSDDAASLVRGRAVLVGVTSESVKDTFFDAFQYRFRKRRADLGHHRARAHCRPTDPGGARRCPEPLRLVAQFRGFVDLGLGHGRHGSRVAGPLPTPGGRWLGARSRGARRHCLSGFRDGSTAAGGARRACLDRLAGLTNRIMYAASNRTRALLRRSFEHYLPPAVIAQMIDSGTLPKLGGERREISVLFTDVAAFTTFSESVEPEFLASMCNEYFEGVCAAIFAEGGMVNEFIGDAVLAFFGAPLDQPDHADRAVSAALGVDAFGRRFSAEQEARGIHFGHTRIGVHTGIAMVGNVGTRSRLKYSAAQGTC